jgi:hypothetical protein
MSRKLGVRGLIGFSWFRKGYNKNNNNSPSSIKGGELD